LNRDADAPLMAEFVPVRENRASARNSRAHLRVRRWHWFIIVPVACGLLAFALPRSRTHILRSAGHALVNPQRPINSADVIVVAIDAGGAGTLGAADLEHRGVSDHVAVFHDPPTEADREFLRRGLPYDDRAAISTRQLQLLGVRNIEQVPRTTTGSEEEGEILPGWCQRHGHHSVVLVTSADHSRRLSRILRRSLRGDPVSVTVVASPYSNFNPDNWWKTRAGARTEIVELEKLVFDIVRHPFS
jgi:hypothetical protein